MSGLPYLRKLSLDDFKISVILSLRVLKYGNISQKSWKLNTRTFSFQASCDSPCTPPALLFCAKVSKRISEAEVRWCCGVVGIGDNQNSARAP